VDPATVTGLTLSVRRPRAPNSDSVGSDRRDVEREPVDAGDRGAFCEEVGGRAPVVDVVSSAAGGDLLRVVAGAVP